MTPTGH